LKVGQAVFIEAKFHVGKGIVLEDDGTTAYPFKVRTDTQIKDNHHFKDDKYVGWFSTSELYEHQEPKEEVPKAEEVYPFIQMPGANDPRYYYLKCGDIVQAGDEVITGLGWRPSVEVGKMTNLSQGGEKSRRRLIKKPDPKKPDPKKYRPLKRFEIIQKGDQYYNAETRAWRNCRPSVGSFVNSWFLFKFRRVS
jgi:hypothetical protein